VTIAADNTGAGKAIETRVALLPLALNGERLGVRCPPPSLGADTRDLLKGIGYSEADINTLLANGVIGALTNHDEGEN
jgi:crotonobetainyl-CoA:carnitine CoA-transferase CaiB-like acyl-CoA transferase